MTICANCGRSEGWHDQFYNCPGFSPAATDPTGLDDGPTDGDARTVKLPNVEQTPTPQDDVRVVLCGPTHHNACACREWHFAQLERRLIAAEQERDSFRRVLEAMTERAERVERIVGLATRLSAVLDNDVGSYWLRGIREALRTALAEYREQP